MSAHDSPAQRRARQWRWQQQDRLHGPVRTHEPVSQRQGRHLPAASHEAVMTLWIAMAAGTGLITGIVIATIR